MTQTAWEKEFLTVFGVTVREAEEGNYDLDGLRKFISSLLASQRTALLEEFEKIIGSEEVLNSDMQIIRNDFRQHLRHALAQVRRGGKMKKNKNKITNRGFTIEEAVAIGANILCIWIYGAYR